MDEKSHALVEEVEKSDKQVLLSGLNIKSCCLLKFCIVG